MPYLDDVHEFSNWLASTADAAGALDAGCLRPESIVWGPLQDAYDHWVKEGNAERLPYMDRTLAERKAPFLTRPWARSAIVVIFRGDWGNSAAPPELPAARPGEPVGFVSRYAFGIDYHRTGHAVLTQFAERLQAVIGRAVRTEPCVDTLPVPEAFLAVTAGLGVRGLNGLARTARHGSRVFAAVLFTELDLPEVTRKQPELALSCEHCRACLRRCPTAALGQDRSIRVDRCRSYLSMEYRGTLSAQQQAWLGDALFGCDVCTAACPPEAPARGYGVDLHWLLHASRGEIRNALRGTALDHAGVTLMKRNAVAILRNQGGKSAESLLAYAYEATGSPVIRQTIDHGRAPNGSCEDRAPHSVE